MHLCQDCIKESEQLSSFIIKQFVSAPSSVLGLALASALGLLLEHNLYSLHAITNHMQVCWLANWSPGQLLLLLLNIYGKYLVHCNRMPIIRGHLKRTLPGSHLLTHSLTRSLVSFLLALSLPSSSTSSYNNVYKIMVAACNLICAGVTNGQVDMQAHPPSAIKSADWLTAGGEA